MGLQCQKFGTGIARNLLARVGFVLCFGAGVAHGSSNSESDLTGTYRAKGDCAYRTEAGDYNTCVAWNELKLTRTENTQLAFELTTQSFATTQGDCHVSGSLQMVAKKGKRYLIGSDRVLKTCHVQLEVTDTSIILESSGLCVSACGLNASLESSPFPRVEKPPRERHCDDDQYHSEDFQLECVTKKYERADRELNVAYRRLMRRLPPAAKEQLRSEQRLWLEGLKSGCGQATGAQQGIRQGELQDCLAQESLRRAEQLVRWKSRPAQQR